MTKSNWKKCKLGDALNFHRGYDLPKEQMTGQGYPVVGSNGIIGYHEEYTTGNPCLVIGRSGNTGKPAIYHYPCWAHNTTLYVDDFKGNNPQYIYYLLKTMDLGSYAAGSAVPTLNRNHIHPLEITLPLLDEQKRIAEVLGAFDDKIELLQKQNKTLEEMAKAIFKSWFVDFDIVKAKQKGEKKEDIIKNYHLTEELYNLFPSSFVDSSVGPIPLGWEVKIIEDLGEVICGKTPSTIHKEYYGGNIPFITIPDMHNNIFAGKTERYLTEEGTQSQSNKTLPPYSVCVSCIATPGLVVMTAVNSQTNQQINSVIPRNLDVRYYNYYILRSVAEQIRVQGSGGSVFGNLNKTSFSKIKILWADENLQKAFTKENILYFDKILNNIQQIKTLTELRDILLPRLISGKIKV